MNQDIREGKAIIPQAEFLSASLDDRWIHQGTGVIGVHENDPLCYADLRGGDAAANAGIIIEIFKGAAGPRRDTVVLNAGAAIMAGGLAATIGEGALLAAEAIDSGRALQKLELLKQFTHCCERS